MNILHLNDKIEISGGVEIYINNLIELMPAYNINPFWIGIYKYKNYFKALQFKNPESENLSFSFENLVKYITEFVEENNIDIIHIHSLNNPKLIEACFKIAPVVRSMHEPRMVCPGQGKFWRHSESICNKPFSAHCLVHAYTQGCVNRNPKRLFDAFKNTYFETRIASRKYAKIIVMSEYMRSLALEVGIANSNISLNPLFTPSFAIEDDNYDKNILKKRVLFVGRLSKTKGVHYFIQLGINILKTEKDVVFDLVGEGHDKSYFLSLIPENVKNLFIFHGWKNKTEIDKIIRNSYLMIFPSIYPEAFGISGIEAMMRGKPVVGFDVGGVSTWLKNSETGYLAPVKDIDGLTEKTVLLLNDQNLYKKMSTASRAVALREFSTDKHMYKLLEIYKKAIK
ncbi:glycosyltransferase family 4 protein [Algibacter sp.]|nr:glycosyltransferase family 4 protein [Algibacter sp.]